MTQMGEFQYKVASSAKKNTPAPALTRRGARKDAASPQRLLAGTKNSPMGQMPTEKGRFSSSGVRGATA